MNLLPQPRFVDLENRLTTNTTLTEHVDASLPPQGYTLTIGDDGVALVGGDDAGCFYGRATLAQLAR
ncbi:MAG: glycoside hydrolase family 20 zincin-like fold domain-containing protein, partial [Actinomycetota bacterium]|nr:glycoside hydrolase family 20 zincin-like fold domain-containing protein [Actinomycetota bacterium]